ncbi:MAG: hypothetical protein HC884_04045 [Chloroflexaceae bacterium]|nr:hypothetical protein [Chloroflexaceae bacterium]
MNTRRGISLSLLLVGALLAVLVTVPPLVQAMHGQQRTPNHAPAVLTPPVEEPTTPPEPTHPAGANYPDR